MRFLHALLPLLLLCGCLSMDEQKVGFELEYRTISQSGEISQGTLTDAISVPRNSAYFQIRANITNLDSIAHELTVLEQKAGPYSTTLPIYSKESINGVERNWRDIGWAASMGVDGIESESEHVVRFEPGDTKALEAPVFFFNELTVKGLSSSMLLEVEIVNASGQTIGTKRIGITLTD